jgi:hypothetical protein
VRFKPMAGKEDQAGGVKELQPFVIGDVVSMAFTLTFHAASDPGTFDGVACGIPA